jgi:peroxiredoxin
LVQLREIEPELKNLGVQLLAISPDKPSKLKETIDKHQMRFRLLSDSDMVAARSFRVAYELDDQTLAEFKKYNIDVEEASGQKHHMLPVPAEFLVATNGLIQFEYVNPDYKVRLDPELLLAAARIIFGRQGLRGDDKSPKH